MSPPAEHVVYIAAPYTNPDPAANVHRVIRVATYLWDRRLCAPLVPHLTILWHLVRPRPIQYWYALDLVLLARCDAVLRLPGESAGADRECEEAERLGIPVFYTTDSLEEWLRDRKEQGVPKLNQVVAIERAEAKDTDRAITRIYHLAQVGQLFEGRTRVYTPKDEMGDRLPAEGERVQATVVDLLADYRDAEGRLLDVTATKVWANTGALADVAVGGKVLLRQVPVEYLLWLEKRLEHLASILSKLPVLDSSVGWVLPRGADGISKSLPAESTRSQKLPEVLTRSPPTEKHPAQTEVIYVDKVVGTWTTTRLSGAISPDELVGLQRRLADLLKAVKAAREQANGAVEAVEQSVAKPLFTYLFGE